MKPTNIRLLAAVPVVVAIGLGLIGFLLWRGQKSLFQSTATVRVIRDATDLDQLGTLAPEGVGTKVFLENEAQAAVSDAVFQKVITRQNLAEAWGQRWNDGKALPPAAIPLLWRERVFAAPEPAAALLHIRVASPDRNHATQLADAVATAYREYRTERRQRVIQEAIDVLAKPYQENREKVRLATEQLEQARLALDETLRLQNPPPRPDFAETEILRGRLNRWTMIYMTQSNQFAQLQNLEAAQIARMQAQLSRTYAELTNATSILQSEVKKQESLLTFWQAQEELGKTRQIFAPIQRTVETRQQQLAATNVPLATLETAATPATPAPAKLSVPIWGCLIGSGLSLLIGVAILRTAHRG